MGKGRVTEGLVDGGGGIAGKVKGNARKER